MTLTPLFALAVRKARDSSRLRGKLGLPDTENPGEYLFEVPDRPEYYYYVRIVQGGDVGVHAAINLTAARIGDLEVRLDYTPSGELYVVGPDLDGLNEFGGQAAPFIGTGPHTHRIGFGNEDMVEGRRLEPGLVHAESGLSVYIEPFHYLWAGVRQYWPGGLLDLTSYRPSTANLWRWVLACVDPADNTATAVAGADYSLSTPLSEDLIADISAPGLIGLDGVKLRGGQTGIDEEDDFAFARPIVTGLGGGSSGDSLLWLSM